MRLLSRDVPLHFLYAIEERDSHEADGLAHNLSVAENAFRQAVAAYTERRRARWHYREG